MSEDDFARITKASKKLNAAADAATAYLLEVEKRLVSAGAGVEVDGPCIESTPYLDENGARRSEDKSITFAKIGDKWRLVLRTKQHELTSSDPDVGDEWEDLETEDAPLLDQPRDIRVKAAPVIPKLLKRIADELERTVTAVENVTKKNGK